MRSYLWGQRTTQDKLAAGAPQATDRSQLKTGVTRLLRLCGEELELAFEVEVAKVLSDVHESDSEVDFHK